jgi:hypothetical protein
MRRLIPLLDLWLVPSLIRLPDMMPPNIMSMNPRRRRTPRRRNIPTNRRNPPTGKYPRRRRTPLNWRCPARRSDPSRDKYPGLSADYSRLYRFRQKLACGRNSILLLLLLAKLLLPLVLFALPLVLIVVLPFQIAMQAVEIPSLLCLRSFVLLGKNGGNRHGSGDNNSHEKHYSLSKHQILLVIPFGKSDEPHQG